MKILFTLYDRLAHELAPIASVANAEVAMRQIVGAAKMEPIASNLDDFAIWACEFNPDDPYNTLEPVYFRLKDALDRPDGFCDYFSTSSKEERKKILQEVFDNE